MWMHDLMLRNGESISPLTTATEMLNKEVNLA